jgi:hypothetical protein
MRVAFWWKLNWSWFCVIQCSYAEARKAINEAEIEPFPDDEAIRRLSEGEKEVDFLPTVKKEEMTTPRSSDQDTISEPMEDVVAQHAMTRETSGDLQSYWDMAKRLNTKPSWPRYLGETEWFAIGDILVEFGLELSKYGLLDMDLGLWENEILHSTINIWCD